MPTFGEKLRREREIRGVPIEEIARITGVDQSHLESLERDDFPALPGRAFGKFFIRLYGEVLGFDPEPLIAEYDRANPVPRDPDKEPARSEGTESHRVESAIHAWRERLRAEREERPDAVEGTAPGSQVGIPEVPQKTVPAQPVRWPRAVLAWILPALLLLSVGVWIYLRVSGRAGGEGLPPPEAASPVVKPAPEVAPSQGAEPPSSDLRPIPPSPAAAPVLPGHLTVPEFGVGRRVADHRLVGPGHRFENGTVVWFLTRVQGGRPGDSVRHVWIHRGRSEQSVDLPLGGPDWRTYSRKRVRGTGSWTVEARDGEGRVLARDTFDCE